MGHLCTFNIHQCEQIFLGLPCLKAVPVPMTKPTPIAPPNAIIEIYAKGSGTIPLSQKRSMESYLTRLQTSLQVPFHINKFRLIKLVDLVLNAFEVPFSKVTLFRKAR